MCMPDSPAPAALPPVSTTTSAGKTIPISYKPSTDFFSIYHTSQLSIYVRGVSSNLTLVSFLHRGAAFLLFAVSLSFLSVFGPCFLFNGATVSELAEYGPRRIFNLNSPHRPRRPQLGFHGLLSCHQVYQELSRLLYASNSFAIEYIGPQSLEPLRNLRPQTCASLTSLRVILAATSCHFSGSASSLDPEWVYGDECVDRSLAWEMLPHRHDKSSDALDPRLAEWDTTTSYLASTLSEGIVDLSVVCDVRDGPQKTSLQAARAVVASLLRLPKLKHCSLRLCQEPVPELQQLAHDTTLRARHIIPPSSSWTPALLEQPSSSSRPVCLLTLPTELRHRIL